MNNLYMTLAALTVAATAAASVPDAPQWLPLHDNAPAVAAKAASRAVGDRSEEIDGVTYEITSDDECMAVRTNKGVNPDTRLPYLPYDFVMPETVEIDGWDYTVTAIGDYAFNTAAIKTITLPKTIRTVGQMAFNQCSILTEVNLNEGLTKLGDYMFYMCQKLTKVNVPSTVTAIPYACFGHCTALADLDIAEGITSIGGAAFFNTNLTEAKLPASLTELGTGAFGMCPYLTAFTVADGNPVFAAKDGMLFSKDFKTLVAVPASIEEVDVPAGTEELAQYAFYYGVGNKYVTLPAGLKKIGAGAFFYANAMKELNIPASVEAIEGGAFAECESLSSVDVDPANENFVCHDGCVLSKDGTFLVSLLEGYTSGNGGFVTLPDGIVELGKLSMCYSQVVRLVMPNTVVVMGDGAMSQARRMTTLTLSNSLAHIGMQACVGWDKMTGNIILPAALQTIGADAFKDTYQFGTVYCLAGVPPVIGDDSEQAFYSNDIANTKLSVVKGAKADYQDAWNWSLFRSVADDEYLLAQAQYDPAGCSVSINDMPAGVPLGVEYRSALKFQISLIGEATIKSVELNGVDVTSQLTPDLALELAKADVKDNQTLVVNLDNVGIEEQAAASQAAPVYYDLMGRRVAQPQHGVFVRVQGGKATKVSK